MRYCDLPLFQLIDYVEDLIFNGEVDNESLINGIIQTGIHNDIMSVPAGMVVDGIGFFGKPGDLWSTRSIDSLISGNWINHNWSNEYSLSLDEGMFRKGFCDTLSSVEGPILEVAAGPGGGNLSPVLQRNPDARIIVNDISIRVLRLWKEYLKGKGTFPNVTFAVFDACSMPLRDGSIHAISSSGGFSNINNSEQAITDAYRVLTKSGRLFALEATVDPDDWSKLPEPAREEIRLLDAYSSLFAKAGFEITKKRISHRRRLDSGDGLALKAAPYGVELHIIFEEMEAVKP